jgi:hypothetical protein
MFAFSFAAASADHPRGLKPESFPHSDAALKRRSSTVVQAWFQASLGL